MELSKDDNKFQAERIYDTLIALCNITNKLIQDKQYQDSVSQFLLASEGVAHTEDKSKEKDQKPTNETVIDHDYIQRVYGIAKGDFEAVISLLALCNTDSGKLTFLQKLISEVNSFGVFGQTKSNDIVNSKGSRRGDDEMVQIMRKINEGKASSRDLFKAIDDEVNSNDYPPLGSITRKGRAATINND